MRSLRMFAGIVMLVSVAVAGGALTGCGTEDADAGSPPDGTITVTDMAGRQITVTTPTKRVVAIGPGALRLVCYTQAEDQVVGIEGMEKQWGETGRPYIMAHPELLDLPVIGQGGPDSTPDPEALLATDPDVIFAAYLVDASKADELQAKTGIPVVVLSYGPLGTFDTEFKKSVEIVGRVTGHEERATAVVDQITTWQSDLSARTADIADADKPAVYVGALGMKGTHGIESTQAHFPPLTAIDATNVVDETGAKGSVMIDKEQLLDWDPGFIFIDESGWSMVKDDYGKNPGLYESLTAVKEGQVHGFLPFNNYTTNVDTAIADAYFMGAKVFPSAFESVDPIAMADEIYTFLVGRPMYEHMAADFGGFKKMELASP